MANTKQQPAYGAKIRQKWYFLVEKTGKTVDEVCKMYMIPRKTYYKWRKIDHADHAYIPKYQRTFIDIYTGLQFATVTSTMTAEDTINAFIGAQKYFWFKILGIQNDNGSENRGEFHQYLGERGISQYFIPKSSPNWDGAVERAHGVIDQEYYLNPTRPWKTLAEYIRFYNYERIHLGKYLNGLIPVEKYQYYLSTVSPLMVN